ncbi:MAG: ribonuclease H-like domain-containing protein [Desulfohalobiaceae bacterium]
MLSNSFLHLPSVGPDTERKFWNSGIRSMQELLESPPAFLSPSRLKTLHKHVAIAQDRLQRQDAAYFCANLPAREHWRIFREHKEKAAYIDIETTGLGNAGDIITTIALYDGRNIKHYIQGRNLLDFKQDIKEYSTLLTYSGKSFDIPFIQSYLGIRLDQAHIDLRYVLRSLGYTGGLKSCERQLGIGRSGCLQDMDGYFAVLLWQDYKQRKNHKSLETLLAYNIQDVLSLEQLMIMAYNEKLRSIPLDLPPIFLPQLPENPFQVHEPTVSRIKDRISRL